MLKVKRTFCLITAHNCSIGLSSGEYGGADDVSRARFTGLGADGNLSYVTFGVGSVFSGNPKHIYDWRKEAGDALMKGGFDNFRYLYNNRPNAMQWDIKQLRDEQTLLQPIHEKYLADKNFFQLISGLMTDVDILDYKSRIRYGCKLLGYTEQQRCKP